MEIFPRESPVPGNQSNQAVLTLEQYTAVMGDQYLKNLEMLQAIIVRMATNQFTCRAWSVSLGTAVIAYAVAKDAKPAAAVLALLPAICFWIQDAYYLSLERAYRDKFAGLVNAGETRTLFDLNVQISSSAPVSAAFSPAVFLVHLPVILIALIVRSNT